MTDADLEQFRVTAERLLEDDPLAAHDAIIQATAIIPEKSVKGQMPLIVHKKYVGEQPTFATRGHFWNSVKHFGAKINGKKSSDNRRSIWRQGPQTAPLPRRTWHELMESDRN
jgi:hypothetical protein